MANVSGFVERTRSRVTAFLKAMEDMKSLQTEFNALGGVAFSNTFDFGGENASTFDMTQAQFNSLLAAIGQLITVYEGGAVSADSTRPAALYQGKV